MIKIFKPFSLLIFLDNNMVKYALTERNVLSVIKHPFIVDLKYAFQSEEELFLLLTYCPGGDLSHQIQREKKYGIIKFIDIKTIYTISILSQDSMKKGQNFMLLRFYSLLKSSIGGG
jgi:serine/threonine protein kinase